MEFALDFLMDVLIILFLLFLLASLVGLAKPSLVKQTSRKKAFIVNLTPSLFIFIAIATLAPEEQYNGSYRIIKDETLHDIKRTVEVTLPERVKESDLKAIAKTIYEDGFERTFIGYRLSGEDNGFFWATSNFDPHLEVKILGSNKETHNKLLAKEFPQKNNVIGQWLVDWGAEYKAMIHSSKDKTIMTTLFHDGTTKEYELSLKEANNQTRYYEEGGRQVGEYYTISPDGELQFWSKNGNYYNAPKLKTKQTAPK